MSSAKHKTTITVVPATADVDIHEVCSNLTSATLCQVLGAQSGWVRQRGFNDTTVALVRARRQTLLSVAELLPERRKEGKGRVGSSRGNHIVPRGRKGGAVECPHHADAI